MNLPLDWLKKYVDISKVSLLDIENSYTSLGFMKDAPTVGNVLSLEIRQNRPDCLSILGLAREIAAIKKLTLINPKVDDFQVITKDSNLVKVEAGNLVKRFSAIKIEGVKITESPDWIKNLLSLYGIPTINNIVDIANFIMIELGQPMHPFDFDKIKGDSLIVRNAKPKEFLETFEAQQIKLTEKDLVISDIEKPIALAGIIGSKNSGITNTTKSVLLEAAVYDNSNIRVTSKRLNIRTEASTRLEKLLNPFSTEIALGRAVALIKELLPDATITASLDYYPNKFIPISIDINPSDVKRIGGIDISKQEIENALHAFGFSAPNFTVPFFRTDIEQKEDLIEEILRYNNYETIPSTPITSPPPNESSADTVIVTSILKEFLVSMGYHEQINNPLVLFDGTPNRISLENPLNKEKNGMRVSILETLKNPSSTYTKHKIIPYKLFEIGNIYSVDNENYSEKLTLGCLFSSDITFRQIKGYIDTIQGFLEVSDDSIISVSPQGFEIALDKVESKDIKKSKTIQWEFMHDYNEEISFLIDSSEPIGNILKALQNGAGAETKIDLIDIYTGENIKEGKKSVLIKVTLLSKENLDPQICTKKVGAIRIMLQELGAEIRM